MTQKKVISVRLEPSTIDRVDEIVRKENKTNIYRTYTRSRFIQRAIQEAVWQEQAEKKSTQTKPHTND